MQRRLLAIAWLASTAIGSPVLAQSAPPTPDGAPPAPAQEATGPQVPDNGSANQPTNSDIVVTALKQGQTVLQAPATINVLEPQALAARNIVAANQLNAVVPGLTMSVAVGGLPGTSFRGLGSNSAVFNVEPSVAEYIDGVYMPHARDYVAPLYDVDHIEFIKGTQSTLLGKNTSLGAISIVNRRPGKQFGYDLQYTHSFDLVGNRVQAAINVPLADTLQVRAAFFASRQDGWIDNVVTNRKEADQRDVSGRIGVAWQPTSDVNVYLSYQHDWRRLRGQNVEVVSDPAGVVATRAAAAGRPFDTRKRDVSASGSFGGGGTAPGTQPFDRQTTDRINGIIDWRLGELTLTSQTSYTTWASPRLTDLDFTAANLFNIVDDEHSKTFTQELRLASPTGGRLQYVAGLFYFFNRWSYGRTFGGAPSNTVGFPLVGLAISQTELPTRSYSAFASGTFELFDGLKVDGGVRYTHEKKEGSFVRRTNGTLVGAFPTVPLTNYAAQTTEPVDYNVGLRYQPTSRLLLYGSYSKGSKSGGFQDAPTTVAGAPFRPETARSAEIGGKLRFTGGYLTVAAFNTKVGAFQTNFTTAVGVPPVSQTVVGNSDVRSRGFEANLSYQPVPDLTLGANVVYADAEFTGNFPASGAIGRKRDRLTRAPVWSGNATVDYQRELGGGAEVFAGLRGDYASKTLYQFVAAQPLAPFGAAHATLDARIGLRSADRGWEVALLGTNITDRRFVEFATSVTAGGGAYYGSFNRPRVIALQFTVKQ